MGEESEVKWDFLLYKKIKFHSFLTWGFGENLKIRPVTGSNQWDIVESRLGYKEEDSYWKL